MNKVIVTGNLVKDVELINTNGKSLVKNSIAVTRNYKNAEGKYDSDFINIIAFGKTAEFMANYLNKGSKVCLDGKIQTGSYTNKDGQKVYTTDLVVENIEPLESKKQDGQAVSPIENKSNSQIVADVMNNDPFSSFGDTVEIDDSNFLE